MSAISTRVQEEIAVSVGAPQSPFVVDASEQDALFSPLTHEEIARRVLSLRAFGEAEGFSETNTTVPTSNVLEDEDDERVFQLMAGHFTEGR